MGNYQNAGAGLKKMFIASVVRVITAIVQIVASILYMIFLNKSYQAFGA